MNKTILLIVALALLTQALTDKEIMQQGSTEFSIRTS